MYYHQFYHTCAVLYCYIFNGSPVPAVLHIAHTILWRAKWESIISLNFAIRSKLCSIEIDAHVIHTQ